jgi:hypothetical protein
MVTPKNRIGKGKVMNEIEITFSEDVGHYEGVVSRALDEDHRLRSPFCRASKTEYVTIELKDGASGIGYAPPPKPRGTNENPP